MPSDLPRRLQKAQEIIRALEAEIQEADHGLIALAAELEDRARRLEANERRFRLMVEGSEEVFFYEHDADHRFTYLSPSVLDVLGYEPARFVGRSYTELLTDDAANGEVVPRTEDVLRYGRTSTTYTAVVRHRDGREICLELVERAVQNEAGVAGIQGFARDITERRAAEHALLESEERHRTILESIEEGYYEIDAAGSLTGFNHALCRILGVSPEAALGLNNRDYMDEENARRVYRAFNGVWTTGHPCPVLDWEVLRPDGLRRHVEGSVSLLRDRAGQPVGFRGIIRDVTDRRRTEEALRETTRTLHALVDASPAAIYVLDRNHHVVLWNPAAERILGWRSVEVLGHKFTDFADPATSGWALLHEQGGDTPPVAATQVAHTRRDGSVVDLGVSVAPLGDSNVLQPTGGIVGIVVDVTEQTRAENALRDSEAQLRQAQKMEAVGRLAGGIAHDFNNVLTAIKGYAAFVQSELPPSSELQQDAAEIVRAADQASNLTRQLLAFSRQQVSDPRVLDVRTVISGMRNMLGRLIGADVQFSVTLPAERAPIRVDPTQVEQVLVNLAVNARDAMPGGGSLSITVEVADHDDTPESSETDPMPAGRYVRLAVTDTGSGIPHDVRERVFEPFFTTKVRGKGTGLGLATVYGIVKQAGGHIFLESESSIGTTFLIFWPLEDSDPEEADVAPPRQPPDSGGSETVLLVEDQPSLRTLVRRTLERAGYRVLQAAHGEEALNVWREHAAAVGLLLTDVVMPQMGGKELAERLRSDRPGLPVLFMSGYAEDHIARQGVLDPGTYLLEKPFDPRTLQRRVREVLDK